MSMIYVLFLVYAFASTNNNVLGERVVKEPNSNIAKLNNGMSFPKVSFGLQVYDDATATKYTKLALEAGIRNFFSSVLAGNQKGFGVAVKAAKTISRSEIFICGSANTASCSGYKDCYTQTQAAWKQNLEDIDVEYLDQIMLDYPSGDCLSIQGQWDAFEEMLKEKKTLSISVSNCSFLDFTD